MSTTSPPLPRLSLYGQIANDFRERILSGELKAGERLPSFTEMRQQHRVSQATLNRVHSLLEAEGLIARRRGAGTFVCDFRAQEALAGGTQNGGAVSFLSRAIVILTPFGKPVPAHQSGGWLEWIAQGATEEVQGAGMHAVSLHPEISDAEIERLIAEKPFGALIPANLSDSATPVHLLRKLRSRGVAVVAFGSSSGLMNCDHVESDHESGAYTLTRHMIEAGKRRILNVQPQDLGEAWLEQRQAGYERAMREAGLEAKEPLQIPPVNMLPSAKIVAKVPGATSSPSHDDVLAGDRRIFEAQVRSLAGYFVEALSSPSPVDGLLATTDRDTFTLAAICRLFGLEPNRDVLIAGYDNYFAECEEGGVAPFVPWATMDKNNRVLGAAMVQLLLQRVRGELPEAPQKRVIEPRLVIPTPSSSLSPGR